MPRRKTDCREDVLMQFQKDWMADRSGQKIWEKSRRIGASWTEACDAVLEAAKTGGQSTYYLSYSKAMTRQFVEDAAAWAKYFGEAASEVQECVIQHENKDITIYRIQFDSGHEIMGMPSEPYSLRSKQGRVVFDEAAFCPKFDEVLKAAKALLIWGGQLVVLSTHNGEDNPFNLLCRKIKDGTERHWTLHRTTFDDAIADGLYRKICLKTGRKWTAKAEKAFVKEIREIYADNLDEELNVIPNRAGVKYFSRLALDHASRDIQMARLELSNDFLFQSPDRKEETVRRWLSAEVFPALGAFDGLMYGGMDFARSGDLSTIWLLEETSARTVETRLMLEIKNCPFEQQKQIVLSILEHCSSRKRLGGFAIDSRGNGQYLGEAATVEYPGAAVSVMLTRQIYAEWLPKLRSYIEEGNFSVPDDNYVKGDFGIVTLKNGVPCIPDVHTADRVANEKRHGDCVVAAMLSMYAWAECSLDPAPVFFPVKKRGY